VALFVGMAIANRTYAYSARMQAARQAALDAQRRVEEERLRIARELHDVVAHTMATITVQAAAAMQLLRDRPDEAAESLKAIRAASKDGLRELRAILDVLRTATDGTDEAADPTQPTPGLSRLDALAAGVRAAGLPVTVTVTGRPRDLPAVTDLSAFRIIQEALTNTLRHAGPATAAVTVDYGEAALRVEVTDTGHGLTDSAAEAAYATFVIDAGFPVPAPVAVRQDLGAISVGTVGHGLRGMRERATAAGGTIDIGPLPAGGFRVTAVLPLAAMPAIATPPATTEKNEKAAR
jgi:signal transduction histidine kinase